MREKLKSLNTKERKVDNLNFQISDLNYMWTFEPGKDKHSFFGDNFCFHLSYGKFTEANDFRITVFNCGWDSKINPCDEC
ncbi:hypothetical protein CSP5_0919 [Cuniculiplasma divulgatum]|jgi:hypothetical protein|uniref:Uncharacterized protein n=1 Tax=Cuniculiplasma divulgatum TaxID=1673428 RepID=A0A1N5UG30_9ARCH|nr:hypothetical protein CSP5_0919 [Cuniculiplasma divulgatum]